MRKKKESKMMEQINEAAMQDEALKVQLMKDYMTELMQIGHEPSIEELEQMYLLF